MEDRRQVALQVQHRLAECWYGNCRSAHCSSPSTYAKLMSAAHSARALLRVTQLGLQGAVGWKLKAVWAGVAQLVEHLICNQRVGGSNPFVSSRSQPAPDHSQHWIVVGSRVQPASAAGADWFQVQGWSGTDLLQYQKDGFGCTACRSGLQASGHSFKVSSPVRYPVWCGFRDAGLTEWLRAARWCG